MGEIGETLDSRQHQGVQALVQRLVFLLQEIVADVVLAGVRVDDKRRGK